MVLRRGERRPVVELIVVDIPEPGFAGLVAGHERVLRLLGVLAAVLRRRAVTAADVTALRAAPQVVPPPAGRLALHATRPAGRHRGVDPCYLRHAAPHDCCLLYTSDAADEEDS